MAWETRGGRGSYYTRSLRRDGRVVREYWGSGAVAELAADFDDLSRAARRLDRLDRDARCAEAVAVASAMTALGRAARIIADLELVLAGYHRHDRGAWRRRRGR